MKIFGKKISDNPNIELVVFPRQEGDIIIKAKAVFNYEEFDALYPRPNPPTVIRRGESTPELDIDDKGYNAKLLDWSKTRTNWMIKESLKATEGIEFETIIDNDPKTWDNISKELGESGFTPHEVNIIMDAIFDANSLNERKLEEAKKRFLVGQGQEQGK